MSRSCDVVLCLLDLRSAFDTLQHEILIQRLADIGVRDKALEWFRSYLVDRTTSVKVNNSRSCCSLVKYGVPQGSVLGPTLFNVYCRPLGRIIRKHDISYHMYADDSQLYVDFSPCDEKTALANLQRCIQEVREWLRENFLLLNDKKTEVVIFGKDATEKQLQIGKSVISSRSAATSLGCILDSKLNMSQQVSRVCKSANYYLHCIRKIRNFISMDACKLLVHTLVMVRLDYCNALLCGAREDVIRQLQSIGILIKIRPYLDKVTLRNLYFTFVYPYLIYCVEVWGNACDTHLDPIIKIQKKCVRVITFSHYLEPTESLFKDLKILAFKKLVIQRILLLMFKHNIGIVPKPIASLFTKKSEIHNYNTRHCSSLHPAIGKSEATYRTFSYHAILIWNYLSKLICTNVTLACFKKRSLVYLQTHLISYRTVR